jgi:hypothetical protein
MMIVAKMKCRFYDLVLTPEERTKHCEAIKDFLNRDIDSPRGGGSAPWSGGKTRMVFFLNEEVADEYEKKMGVPK